MLSIIELDEFLFILINQKWANPAFDAVMIALSSKWFMVPLTILSILVFAVFLKKHFWLPLVFMIVSTAMADIVSSRIFKPAFKRTRPCNVEHLHARIPYIKSSSYGFVSSHAANAFAAMYFLFLFSLSQKSSIETTKRKLLVTFSLLCLLIAFFISYSRVYLGVHYPFDILGGALLGCLFSTVLFYSFKKIQFQLDKKTS